METPRSKSSICPSWPRRRVLELAPANWKKILENEDAQQRLADNVFPRAVIALDQHPPIQ